jgi:hypothetical protein
VCAVNQIYSENARILQVKPVVLAGEDRPIGHNFGGEHENKQPPQHKEFNFIFETIQRSIKAVKKEQQKWNQCTEQIPTG